MRIFHNLLRPALKFRKNLVLWLTVAMVGNSLPAIAEVTYTYTGNFFTQANPPFTTSDRITGMFTVALPLPPYLSNVDISPWLTSMRFQDGIQVRTARNSQICSFLVTTDGNGRLLKWSIYLREDQIPTGNSMFIMDVTDTLDQSGAGLAPANPCDSISLTSSALALIPGTWQVNLPFAQPTTYTYQGSLFEIAPPPYSQNQRVVGTLSLPGPLPPWMPMRSIAPFLINFQFSDGVQTRTPANTAICRFEVSTDGAGHINNWSLSLRQKTFTMGNPQQIIDSTNLGDTVGTGIAGPFECSPTSFNLLASSSIAGQWTDPLPMGTPTDYVYSGSEFDLLQPPYQMGDRLTGFLSFANPLPAYLSQANLVHALEDFEFQDGIQLRNPTNTEVCYFQVSTGSMGEIWKWSMGFRETPFILNQAQETIDTSWLQDSVGAGPAGGTACALWIHSFLSTASQAGSWSAPLGPSAPAVYLYSGRKFTSAQPPFQSSQKIAGRVVLPGPLPSNFQLTDVTPHVIDFRFYDGTQVQTSASSQMCQFALSADASGQIVAWRVFLREAVVQNMNQFSLFTASQGLVSSDQSSLGLAGIGVCDSNSPTSVGEVLLKGSWFRLCDTLREDFPLWPEQRNVLELLAISCREDATP